MARPSAVSITKDVLTTLTRLTAESEKATAEADVTYPHGALQKQQRDAHLD